MWIRKLAWLHATPEKEKKPRIELLEGQEIAELPELNWGRYIIDFVFEIGLSTQTPIAFCEIKAWADVTKTFLPSQEAILINRLSREYCNQYHLSNNTAIQSPDSGENSSRAAAANGLAELIERFRE